MQQLVLLLDAPLQSWGELAGFPAERPTALMPTLSGVGGMIANALGMRRGDPLDGIADAEMWVRADRPPAKRLVDFHTVGNSVDGTVIKPQTGKAGGSPIVTRRHYLSDAAFTVMWSPGDGLDPTKVAAALESPARPIYLGRRSCPPAQPVLLGVTEKSPDILLRETLPLLRDKPKPAGDYFSEVEATSEEVRADIQFTVAAPEARAVARHDVPVTFNPRTRWHYHNQRWTVTDSCGFPVDMCAGRGRAGRDQLLSGLHGGFEQ